MPRENSAYRLGFQLRLSSNFSGKTYFQRLYPSWVTLGSGSLYSTTVDGENVFTNSACMFAGIVYLFIYLVAYLFSVWGTFSQGNSCLQCEVVQVYLQIDIDPRMVKLLV